MKLRIIAKNNRGFFAGYNEEFGHVVISLDGMTPIELNDVLSSETWDDSDGLFKYVMNLTSGDEVKICIENWSLSKNQALRWLS